MHPITSADIPIWGGSSSRERQKLSDVDIMQGMQKCMTTPCILAESAELLPQALSMSYVIHTITLEQCEAVGTWPLCHAAPECVLRHGRFLSETHTWATSICWRLPQQGRMHLQGCRSTWGGR